MYLLPLISIVVENSNIWKIAVGQKRQPNQQPKDKKTIRDESGEQSDKQYLLLSIEIDIKVPV